MVWYSTKMVVCLCDCDISTLARSRSIKILVLVEYYSVNERPSDDAVHSKSTIVRVTGTSGATKVDVGTT